MEYEKIKQLMEDMGNSKLTDIDIEFPDGTKISMKKQTIVEGDSNRLQNELNDISLRRKFVEQNTLIENPTKIETKKDEGNIVKSPMVGTFYIKPSPTSNPYVQIGTEVTKGETLCIIEAMKLMNEIESEFTGKITEILVKDGETVEYGTPLFIIK
ncbi:MAG: acetyl-CoA carboxylase biotin carboxyl carrier protein [Clostridia bacterium]|nr:acetyl-CoA carboxylase biotin carboxyl carrier protein [Clostridia bacterium]